MDRRAEYLRRVCRLQGEELSASFEGYWVGRHGRKPLEDARFVLTSGGWLTLAGKKGVGKTYLLCAVVNEAVRRNRLAVYIGMSDLLDHLRRAYKPEAEVGYDDLWQTIVRCEVLCIDEVEKYQPTPWAQERVQMLADDRYRRWRDTVTVWAANEVAECPGYLKSRMLDGRFKVCVMNGDDCRPGLRRQQEQ